MKLNYIIGVKFMIFILKRLLELLFLKKTIIIFICIFTIVISFQKIDYNIYIYQFAK